MVTTAILAMLFWQQIATPTYGLSGPAVTTTQSDGSVRQTVHNLNGREVPVQSVEDRIVTDTPALRVIERTIHRYDANGRPGPAGKMRIETRTAANDTTEVTATTWRGDINGNLQVAERSRAVTRKSGPEAAETTVTVERPASDGRLELYEKKQETRLSPSAGRITETATIERKDLNGRWAPVSKVTAEKTSGPASAEENRAEYEAATTGQMRLVRQIVSRTTQTAGGAAVTEADIFEPAIAGRVSDSHEPPALVRRQIVEHTPVPGGAVETVTVRFADASSPGRLSPPQKVEETICKGACRPAMMK